ncbi:unnamed protein product, partial [Effrenium voratum]
IVTFDNFVSEAEIADMLSNVKEFQRSSDQGEYDEFGLMKARLDTMTKASRQKLFGPARLVDSEVSGISDVIQVPSANFEEMQFL